MSDTATSGSGESARAVGETASARRLDGTTILFLNNYSGPGLGGGEVHMRAIMVAARDAGASVVLACHPGTDVEREFAAMGFVVHTVELGAPNLPGSARRLRRVTDEVRPDIVHSNGWLTNAVARHARTKGDFRLVTSVLVDPDAPALSGASRLEQVARNTIDKLTIGRADAIAPITQAVAAKLEGLGAPPERVTVIPGAVDAEAIRVEAAEHSAPFTREPDTAYVGFVGRLETVKGPETLVRALPYLASVHPQLRVVIGGAGSLDSSLRTTAVALGVSDWVEFPGAVPSAAATFAALDVVVIPSLSEGFGLVAAEAGALGKPVVASRAGGLPEVVTDGVTGVLVKPGDPRALADAVSSLLDEPERAAAMGAAARERIERDFSADRMARAYLDLYASLLET